MASSIRRGSCGRQLGIYPLWIDDVACEEGIISSCCCSILLLVIFIIISISINGASTKDVGRRARRRRSPRRDSRWYISNAARVLYSSHCGIAVASILGVKVATSTLLILIFTQGLALGSSPSQFSSSTTIGILAHRIWNCHRVVFGYSSYRGVWSRSRCRGC
jgi:hypothetical protein